MKHLTVLRIALLALPSIAAFGCGDDPPSKPSPVSSGSSGSFSAGSSGTTAVGAAGAAARPGSIAGRSGGAAGTLVTSGTGAAGYGVVVGAGTGATQAGSTGAAGVGGGPVAGNTPAAGSGGGPTAQGGLEPIIPEVMGECPAIKAGNSTVTVMGLRATVIAGEKQDKTGSLLIYYYGTGKLGAVSSLPAAIKTDITSQGGIVFALNEAKNTGGDCSGTGTFGIDDFNVVDQFVACAVRDYGIDPKRIYATGCSAGGLTSGCMGIRRSNYIAAVAPNSGGVTIGYGKLQDPTRVPNVITMNGGSGDNVIVNFGETSEGYDNYILKYGGFAVNCVHSSGHCGAPAALYSSAWQFLKDHPYGTKPSPYAGGLPSGFHPSCKIFEMTERAPLGGY